MEPFFSIVLPTYNRAKFLPGAIKSVLDQEFTDWELLIVDDGSTDDTKAVVHNIKDTRIKYIYQNNAERSAARNLGIEQSVGKFITFLDSDDQYASDHLVTIYNEIENNSFKEAVYVVKSTALKTPENTKSKREIKTGENDLETVLLNSITPGQITVPQQLMKKQRFNEKIRISEDTELLVRLVNSTRLKIINTYSFNYVLHEDNSVNVKKYNAYLDRKKTLELIFTYPEAKNISSKFKNRLLNNCYFGIYSFYNNQQKRLKAKLVLLEALIKHPLLRTKEKLYLLISFNRKVN